MVSFIRSNCQHDLITCSPFVVLRPFAEADAVADLVTSAAFLEGGNDAPTSKWCNSLNPRFRGVWGLVADLSFSFLAARKIFSVWSCDIVAETEEKTNQMRLTLNRRRCQELNEYLGYLIKKIVDIN